MNYNFIKREFIKVILLSLFLITSCSEPNIYKAQRVFVFNVSKFDNSNVRKDTLTLNLNILDEIYYLSNVGQRKITYTYDSFDSLGNKTHSEEQGGMIDRGSNLITTIFFQSPKIRLKPPTIYKSIFFKQTVLLPFPNVIYPLFIGQKNDWDFVPKIGWKEYSFTPIKGNTEVIKKEYFDNNIIKDSIWVINAVGNSEAGTFKSVYYFSEIYGFVYLLYDFNNYKIEMELKKVNF